MVRYRISLIWTASRIVFISNIYQIGNVNDITGLVRIMLFIFCTLAIYIVSAVRSFVASMLGVGCA